jgi:hypothetical protein
VSDGIIGALYEQGSCRSQREIPHRRRPSNPTPSTPLRAGSNVEERDVRMGHPASIFQTGVMLSALIGPTHPRATRRPIPKGILDFPMNQGRAEPDPRLTVLARERSGLRLRTVCTRSPSCSAVN